MSKPCANTYCGCQQSIGGQSTGGCLRAEICNAFVDPYSVSLKTTAGDPQPRLNTIPSISSNRSTFRSRETTNGTQEKEDSYLLIKANLPDNCAVCEFNHGEKRPERGLSVYCPYFSGIYDQEFYGKRLPQCRLTVIPESEIPGQAEWEWDEEMGEYFCSRCGKMTRDRHDEVKEFEGHLSIALCLPHFCGNCGARMREG